jgi:hypothetical protein
VSFLFLMTFEIVEKNRKSFVKFHLFRKFNKVEFSGDISGTSARLRFSEIHNHSLRFLHRWMSFMLPWWNCVLLLLLSLNVCLLW